ncbi:hypothetical protein JTE90_019320 [Oedothorax gibbosus]|uniref:Uncharacterized protein n=1 Tax=Oedothorax gibbosus TaxID=931172 RepID=A0AAV6TKZ4_9ARAC|nr:hypothetical protein JTE90_019320 [Oedothorax gibbosus]
MMRKGEIEAMAKAEGIAVCHVHSKDMKYLAPGMVHQAMKEKEYHQKFRIYVIPLFQYILLKLYIKELIP